MAYEVLIILKANGMKKKVLIIKLGYSETLVNEKGFTPSLGDVFRHTVLLHHYSNDEVTWLTSESALPLLKDNHFINKLMIYSKNTEEELKNCEFDEVLCLEKAPVFAKLLKSINSTRFLGFNCKTSGASAYRGAEPAMEIANGADQFLPLQALLFQMVNDYWHGENYILGYKPKTIPPFDVGFNHLVGSKWPSKSWPERNWKILEELLANHGLIVSWQQGEKDIELYMDWINAGRLIVTCDSLGMHLGLAMKKKVVALFGPTPAEQIYMYGRGVTLTAEWACEKAPCWQPSCEIDKLCMAEIKPHMVARVITNLINGKS